jgi:predicted RNase H-like nuclease (RuvC/YqgF family)
VCSTKDAYAVATRRLAAIVQDLRQKLETLQAPELLHQLQTLQQKLSAEVEDPAPPPQVQRQQQLLDRAAEVDHLQQQLAASATERTALQQQLQQLQQKLAVQAAAATYLQQQRDSAHLLLPHPAQQPTSAASAPPLQQQRLRQRVQWLCRALMVCGV